MTSPSELGLQYYQDALEGTKECLKDELMRSATLRCAFEAIRFAVSDTETYGLSRGDDAGRLANRIRSVLAEVDE